MTTFFQIFVSFNWASINHLISPNIKITGETLYHETSSKKIISLKTDSENSEESSVNPGNLTSIS